MIKFNGDEPELPAEPFIDGEALKKEEADMVMKSLIDLSENPPDLLDKEDINQWPNFISEVSKLILAISFLAAKFHAEVDQHIECQRYTEELNVILNKAKKAGGVDGAVISKDERIEMGKNVSLIARNVANIFNDAVYS